MMNLQQEARDDDEKAQEGNRREQHRG